MYTLGSPNGTILQRVNGNSFELAGDRWWIYSFVPCMRCGAVRLEWWSRSCSCDGWSFVGGPRRTRQICACVCGTISSRIHCQLIQLCVLKREKRKKRTKNWLALRWVWALMYASIRSIYSMAFEMGMAGWLSADTQSCNIHKSFDSKWWWSCCTLEPRKYIKSTAVGCSVERHFFLLFSVQLITINVFESLFV